MTLSYKDTIQRVGYTIIDGTKVVQYNCIIPVDKPDECLSKIGGSVDE